MWCVHGGDIDYPIADINSQVEGQQYSLAVVVMDKLPYQVELGRDLPILRELIAKAERKDPGVSCEGMIAVTRSDQNTVGTTQSRV